MKKTMPSASSSKARLSALVSGGSYTPISTNTVSQFTDISVSNGTPYFYVVTAVNSEPILLEETDVEMTMRAFPVASALVTVSSSACTTV